MYLKTGLLKFDNTLSSNSRVNSIAIYSSLCVGKYFLAFGRVALQVFATI